MIGVVAEGIAVIMGEFAEVFYFKGAAENAPGIEVGFDSEIVFPVVGGGQFGGVVFGAVFEAFKVPVGIAEEVIIVIGGYFQAQDAHSKWVGSGCGEAKEDADKLKE